MKKILATTAFLVLTCSVIAAISVGGVGDIDSIGDRPGTFYENTTPLQTICTTPKGRPGVKVVCVSQPEGGCVAMACVAVTGLGEVGD